MSKIRESGLLKFVAGLFLGLGIIAGILSGITCVYAYYEDYYNPGGEERVRESIIQDIAFYYNNEAINYYRELLYYADDKENYEGIEKYYEDYFSEENTNYMFAIYSDEDRENKAPLLDNYYVDDVQYKGEEWSEVCLSVGSEKISCSIDVSDIIRSASYEDLPEEEQEIYGDGDWWYYSVPNVAVSYYDYGYAVYVDDSETDNTSVSVDMSGVTEAVAETTTTTVEPYIGSDGQYYYIDENGEEHPLIEEETTFVNPVQEDTMAKLEAEENKNRVIYAYSQPLNLNNVYAYDDGEGIIICIDDTIEYDLTDNAKYQFVHENFLEKTKEYDYVERTGYDYDVVTGELVEYYEVGYVEEILLQYSIKSDLTANDQFAASLRLKYLTQIFDAALPVFVISCLVILVTFIYLIFAVGHRRDAEGITLSRFDNIPYDIILAVYVLWCGSGLAIANDYLAYGYNDLLTAVFYGMPLMLAVLVFPLIIATTAVRLKVGNIFKNTVIARVLKWTWKVVKKLWTELRSVFKYLRENVKLIWKWLLGFTALGIFEFLLCMMFWDATFTLMLLIIDFFIVAAALAFGAINMHKLKEGAKKIAAGNVDYKLDTDHMLWEFKNHGETLNNINDGISVAVNERLKSEHMQTELITNVTHDIKTPLTSIISYVDLLSKEELNNDKAKEYVEVLARQSDRLKKLIEDLIEASKATTGNLKVELSDVDVKVLLDQSLGEFSDKLSAKELKPIVGFHTEDTVVRADGKHLWRVFDNLINNISKYAQDNTRVYIDVERNPEDGLLRVAFKNISKEELNISGEELMERFVRGDKSRNTEGNGLGLSIAKSLMKIQDGDLQIIVDGDLFKVIVILK